MRLIVRTRTRHKHIRADPVFVSKKTKRQLRNLHKCKSVANDSDKEVSVLFEKNVGQINDWDKDDGDDLMPPGMTRDGNRKTVSDNDVYKYQETTQKENEWMIKSNNQNRGDTEKYVEPLTKDEFEAILRDPAKKEIMMNETKKLPRDVRKVHKRMPHKYEYEWANYNYNRGDATKYDDHEPLTKEEFEAILKDPTKKEIMKNEHRNMSNDETNNNRKPLLKEDQKLVDEVSNKYKELMQTKDYELMKQMLLNEMVENYKQALMNGATNKPESLVKRELKAALGRACHVMNKKVGQLIEQIKETDAQSDMMNVGFENKVHGMNNRFERDLAQYSNENARRNGTVIKTKNGKFGLNEKMLLDNKNGKNGRDFGFRKMSNFLELDFISPEINLNTQKRSRLPSFEQQFGNLGSFGTRNFASHFLKKPTRDLMGNRILGNGLFANMLVTKPHMNFMGGNANKLVNNPLLGIGRLI